MISIKLFRYNFYNSVKFIIRNLIRYDTKFAVSRYNMGILKMKQNTMNFTKFIVLSFILFFSSVYVFAQRPTQFTLEEAKQDTRTCSQVVGCTSADGKPRPCNFSVINSNGTFLPEPIYSKPKIENNHLVVIYVHVFIDEKGNVYHAKSCGTDNKELRDAALIAAKKAKFKPITFGGKAIKIDWLVSYSFRKKKEKSKRLRHSE